MFLVLASLGDSDAFQILWPIALMPVSYAVNRHLDRRLPDPRATRLADLSPKDALALPGFSVAHATASAHATAHARAEAKITVGSPGGDDLEWWQQLLVAGFVVLVVAAAGYGAAEFFASLGTFLIALGSVSIGCILAGMQRLRAAGSVLRTWRLLLFAVGSIATATAFSGVGLREPRLAGNPYTSMYNAFEQRGRSGVVPFGEVHSGLLLFWQGASAVFLILLTLVALVMLVLSMHVASRPATRYPRLRAWLQRHAKPGHFALASASAITGAVFATGLAYNWSYGQMRSLMDNNAPLISDAGVRGRARPALVVTAREIVRLSMVLERRGSNKRYRIFRRTSTELYPGRARVQVLGNTKSRLPPGHYRLVVRASDVAGNSSRAQAKFRVSG